MDSEFLRGLLYRAESVDLDFKREQYKLSGSEQEKSEVVKDVLAMANAWRESTGYILLGVAENKGELPTVVGITDMHDDAHFQQLVNSKVQPKVEFAYEVCKLDGLLVGVIAVLKQRRPFFLPKRFGNVEADTVYLRRGSSTAIAKPDEIARMGAMEAERRPPPKVELALVDQDGKDALTRQLTMCTVGFGQIDAIPKYTIDRAIAYPLDVYNATSFNRNFWRDAARYVKDRTGACLLYVRVKSSSSYALTHCKLELHFDDGSGEQMDVREESQLAAKPQHGLKIPPLYSQFDQPDVSVTEAKLGPVKCIFSFDKFLAGDTVTSSSAFALFPQESGSVAVTGQLYAQEL